MGKQNVTSTKGSTKATVAPAVVAAAAAAATGATPAQVVKATRAVATPVKAFTLTQGKLVGAGALPAAVSAACIALVANKRAAAAACFIACTQAKLGNANTCAALLFGLSGLGYSNKGAGGTLKNEVKGVKGYKGYIKPAAAWWANAIATAQGNGMVGHAKTVLAHYAPKGTPPANAQSLLQSNMYKAG